MSGSCITTSNLSGTALAQPPQLLRTVRKTINLQFLVDHIDLGWKGWDFCPEQNGPGWWWLEGLVVLVVFVLVVLVAAVV